MGARALTDLPISLAAWSAATQSIISLDLYNNKLCHSNGAQL